MRKILMFVLIGSVLVTGLYAKERIEQSERNKKEPEKIKKKIKQVELPVKKRIDKRQYREAFGELLPKDKIKDSVKIKLREEIKKNIDNKSKKEKIILDNFRTPLIKKSKNEKYYAGIAIGEYKGKSYSKYLVTDREGNLINIYKGWEMYGDDEVLKTGYVSDGGAFVYQNGKNFTFYGKGSDIKKEYSLNASWDVGNSYAYPIKNENKILLCGKNGNGIMEMRTFEGKLLWEKELEGGISPYNFIFSKNMKYFGFVVDPENSRPKTVIMDIGGRIVQEVKECISSIESGIISNDGKRMAVLDSNVKYYDIEKNELLWVGMGEPLPRTRIEEKSVGPDGREFITYKYYGSRYGRDMDMTPDGKYIVALSAQKTGLNEYGAWYITLANKYKETLFEKKFNKKIVRVMFGDDKGKVIKVVTEDEIIELDSSEYIE